ncbi:NUDIX domain-containing protein [Microvirga tunisiensis]|uniref:NUDIX domain-containing protein n=1 Tax=Pannonibacter tanglangensis TaxID=2750084 RepID=A0A7X5F0B1_9HYPH|nr:NUDIX hydrolase [Pannonibacter sp. XCT-53]NBN77406.1 NUDIX domain-containing protein [Pannonibacter sp. XCT-53]
MTGPAVSDLLAEARANKSHPALRPRDAATLLILDRSGPQFRVLMGRRHKGHVFMPGMFVFPGGRVDPTDSRVPVADDYHPDVAARLAARPRGRLSSARLRAFTVAAVRETYEEAGLFVGLKSGRSWRAPGDFAAFSDRGIEISLAPMRMIARAITPPGRPRRFDTRFLAVFSDAIADRLPDGTGPSGELEDVAWLTLAETAKLDLPVITQKILADLDARLAEDPDLAPSTPVPFYFLRGQDFQRDLI